MDPEDFLTPEVGITAVVVGTLFSPGGRRVLRRALVYGTAGALAVGDAVTSLARRFSSGVKHAGAPEAPKHQGGTEGAASS